MMVKVIMNARLVIVLGALLLGLGVGPARALEAKIFSSNINPQVLTDSQSHFFNLTGAAGNDSIVIPSPNLGEDEFIIIWFAAECAVAAADTRTWLDIDILVNGVELPPTDENNAFCTSNGTSTLPYVSAATHGAFADVVHTMPASSYQIQVRARLHYFDQGDRALIDDLSLMIFVE